MKYHQDNKAEKEYKYWAFISYCHSDENWGKWLHKALESYRIPSKFVNTTNRSSQIPKRIYPIFRDREEFSSAPDLRDSICQALRSSRYLIVICSPRSAVSEWVNKEINFFKSIGRQQKILCLIVDGTPNASDNPEQADLECFPDAVRYGIGNDGKQTKERINPIAPDIRKDKDGKRNALLKVIAGILSIDYNDLKQRDQSRSLRRIQLFSFVAVLLIAVLTLLSTQLYHARNVAKENEVIAQENEAKALDRLVKIYRKEGIELYLDGILSESLAYFKEILLIKPDYASIKLAISHVWSKLKSLRAIISGEEKEIVNLNFSIDGEHLISQDDHGKIRIIRFDGARSHENKPSFIGYMKAPLFAEYFDYLASISRTTNPKNPNYVTRYIDFIDWRLDSVIYKIELPNKWPRINSLVLSPGGKYLLATKGRVTSDEDVVLWNMSNPNFKPIMIEVDDNADNYIWRFTADDKRLLQIHYVGNNYFMVIRDVSTGDEINKIPLNGIVKSIDMFADKVALGLHNGTVCLYRVDSDVKLIFEDSKTHQDEVRSLDFSSDGKKLLIADILGFVSIIDVKNRLPQKSWNNREINTNGVLYDAVLSPNGKMLAFAHGRVVDIYRLADMRHIYHFTWQGSEASSLAFDAKSLQIAVGTRKGDIKVWMLNSDHNVIINNISPPKEEKYFYRVQSIGHGEYLVFGNNVYSLSTKNKSLQKIDTNFGDAYTISPLHKIWIKKNWRNINIEKRDANNTPIFSKSINFDDEPYLFSTPISSSIPIIIVLSGGRIMTISADGHIKEHIYPSIKKIGNPISSVFSNDGETGFISFNSGHILQLKINNNGINNIIKHRIEGADKYLPFLIDFTAKSNCLLLKMNNVFYNYNTVKEFSVKLSNQSIVNATILKDINSTQILSVDKKGIMELWNTKGRLVKMNNLASRTITSSNILDQHEKNVGHEIAISPSGDKAATTINGHIFIWGLPDIELLWRSDPLFDNKLNVIDFTDDGKYLIIASSGYSPEYIDDIIFIRIPDKMPSIKEVDQFLQQVANLKFIDGNMTYESKKIDDSVNTISDH